jgi:hypothetical protein
LRSACERHCCPPALKRLKGIGGGRLRCQESGDFPTTCRRGAYAGGRGWCVEQSVPAALYNALPPSSYAAGPSAAAIFGSVSPAGVLSSVNTILQQRQLQEPALCYTVFDLKRRVLTRQLWLPCPIRYGRGCAQIELPKFRGSFRVPLRRDHVCACMESLRDLHRWCNFDRWNAGGQNSTAPGSSGRGGLRDQPASSRGAIFGAVRRGAGFATTT